MSLILTLNAGSSSIKAALYDSTDALHEVAHGQVEDVGTAARLEIAAAGQKARMRDIGPADHAQSLEQLLAALRPLCAGRQIAAVGHRIVHGGAKIDGPRVLTDAVLNEVAALGPLAPLHQPHNLDAVRAAKRAFPKAVQVGVFDTAFHHGHDFVHDTFGLPRRFYDQGVRRYGFHGLSYASIAGRLARDHPDLAAGRVIVGHLGNGASLCALSGGRSVDTTMGFSALDGLPMGTRVGQLDPGVILYLLDQGMDAAALTQLFYEESGLKGLSGISHDMRVLLASPTPEAAQAIGYFTARLAREIGAMAAVLGGLDALVFTGGIGENAAPIRAMALEKLGFLGLVVEPAANASNALMIHAGKAPILVMATDEERVIAQAANDALLTEADESPT